eukprot:2435770-Pyramimonas_sp.AAC.1
MLSRPSGSRGCPNVLARRVAPTASRPGRPSENAPVPAVAATVPRKIELPRPRGAGGVCEEHAGGGYEKERERER